MSRHKGGFKVTVTLNKSRISELTSAAILAAEDTANFIKNKLIRDEVIPFSKGELQGSMFLARPKKGSVYIAFSASHADEVYNATSRTFNRSINSNAKALWMDDYLSRDKELVIQTYVAALRKRGRL